MTTSLAGFAGAASVHTPRPAPSGWSQASQQVPPCALFASLAPGLDHSHWFRADWQRTKVSAAASSTPERSAHRRPCASTTTLMRHLLRAAQGRINLA